MITIRKLETLAPSTALRKAARLFQGFEEDISCGRNPDIAYIRSLTGFTASSPLLQQDDRNMIAALTASLESDPVELKRTCNSIHHIILKTLSEEPADWDMIFPSETESGGRKTLPFGIYLDDVRSPFNVGSIFRTSESFGVKRITISPGTASPFHRRAVRSSMGCTDKVPWEVGKIEDLAGRNVFALELKGTPIDDFRFPEDGIAVIGSEELGVSPAALALADSSAGRVSIPLYGTKGSLNVSVAFGILMHRWVEAIKKERK